MITGNALSTGLRPVLNRAAAPFPGGHLRVAGHLVVASVAVSLCGLVFALVVTNTLLKAFSFGLRDFEMHRVGQYFWVCLPFAIAIALVRQASIAFTCGTTMVLLIALGIWTHEPPEVAFSKTKVAVLVWRSHVHPRLPFRNRTRST